MFYGRRVIGTDEDKVKRMMQLLTKFLAPLLTPRGGFLSLALYCGLMMLVALLYFQAYLNLDPCPLCVVQRVFVIATALVAIIAFIHNPSRSGRKLYAGVAMLPTLAGIGTAWRHLWLQSLPADQLPECGPGLDYMMEIFSFTEVLQKVFFGSGECGEVLWNFLGLSIPAWTLVGFLILLAIEVYQFFRRD